MGNEKVGRIVIAHLQKRMKLKNILLITSLFIIHGCVIIKESSFQQEKYLDSRKNNPIELYKTNDAQKDKFLPIMDFHPHSNVRGIITKLLLIEFLNHPDYYMIELQEVIDGESIGMVALIYGHNNEIVDIYFTNQLALNKREYESLLNRVTVQESDFESTLELNSNGLSASLLLKDRNGINIELEIRENRAMKEPKGLLAPIGSGSIRPDKFPFIYLKGFTMIKQKGTICSLKIGGKDYIIDRIPALVDFEKVYNAKYSFENLLIDWNKNYDGTVHPISIKKGQTLVSYETWDYFLNTNEGFIEIDAISTTVNDKSFTLYFSPAIPNLMNLQSDIFVDGKFAVQIDDISSVLGGVYKIETDKNRLNFEMQFEKGWQPMPGRLWIKDYKWTLELEQSDSQYFINTYWENAKATKE
jgi:hypothetical protein